MSAAPGRRAAPRRARREPAATRPGGVVPLAAVLAVLATVALLVAGGLRDADDVGAGTSTALTPRSETAVAQTVRSCGVPGTDDVEGEADVATLALPSDLVGDLPADAATPDDRAASSAVLRPDGTAEDRLVPDAAGAWSSTSVETDGPGAVLLDVTGGLAPGARAWTASVPPRSLGGGLAVGACPAPASRWWFLGLGATTTHASTLLLANPTASRAVVDVAVHDPEGEVAVVGGRGIVLEPEQVTAVPLADLATGLDDLAVSVVADRGQVTAQVLDTTARGGGLVGSDWVGGAVPPARDLLVPGVPGGTRRELVVVNPGDRSTVVGVTTVGPEGSFDAADLAEVDVAAGATATVEVPRGLGARPFALRLEADVPVTAAVRATTDEDEAVLPATAATTGAVVLPMALDALDGTDARLTMTPADPEQEATVVLTAHDRAGEVLGEPVEVAVGAGTSAVVDPDAELDAPDRTAYVTATAPGAAVAYSLSLTDPDGGLAVLVPDSPATVLRRPAVGLAG